MTNKWDGSSDKWENIAKHVEIKCGGEVRTRATIWVRRHAGQMRTTYKVIGGDIIKKVVSKRGKWSRTCVAVYKRLQRVRKSTWTFTRNRSNIKVSSKWHRSDTEANRSDLEVKSKRHRSDIEAKSKWTPCAIEVQPKWHRSEIEVNSKISRRDVEVRLKWTRSENEVQSTRHRSETEVTCTRNQVDVEVKWNRSGIEVKSKWLRKETEVRWK